MILRLRFVVIDNCSFVTALDWVRILKISKEIFCYHKKKERKTKKIQRKTKIKESIISGCWLQKYRSHELTWTTFFRF